MRKTSIDLTGDHRTIYQILADFTAQGIHIETMGGAPFDRDGARIVWFRIRPNGQIVCNGSKRAPIIPAAYKRFWAEVSAKDPSIQAHQAAVAESSRQHAAKEMRRHRSKVRTWRARD